MDTATTSVVHWYGSGIGDLFFISNNVILYAPGFEWLFIFVF